MSDLPRRLAVAAVGIPVVLGLLYLGGWWLAVPLAVMAALGARELGAMAAARAVRAFDPLAMAGAAGLVLLASWAGAWGSFAAPALLLVTLLGALAMTLALGGRDADSAPLGSVAVTVFGVLYAGVSMACIPFLHALPYRLGWAGEPASAWAGAVVVVLPLAATWIGDSAAYFGGTAWGRNGPKLAPTISPNKSWIGSACGLVGSAVGAVLWLLIARETIPAAGLPSVVTVVGIGLVLGVGAQIGDLVESLMKREAGVKDSGALFPGHGGVLDRLDALVFTVPLAYAALLMAGMLG